MLPAGASPAAGAYLSCTARCTTSVPAATDASQPRTGVASVQRPASTRAMTLPWNGWSNRSAVASSVTGSRTASASWDGPVGEWLRTASDDRPFPRPAVDRDHAPALASLAPDPHRPAASHGPRRARSRPGAHLRARGSGRRRRQTPGGASRRTRKPARGGSAERRQERDEGQHEEGTNDTDRRGTKHQGAKGTSEQWSRGLDATAPGSSCVPGESPRIGAGILDKEVTKRQRARRRTKDGRRERRRRKHGAGSCFCAPGEARRLATFRGGDRGEGDRALTGGGGRPRRGDNRARRPACPHGRVSAHGNRRR